ncbi:hypothetical protein [Mucilaginibacter sp.]
MKTITLHKPLNIDSIYNYLAQNLNPLFNKHKPTIFKYNVNKTANAIEITQPEMYEGVLFHIELDNCRLKITRSEHYVDDVNSLTLESVMNELFNDLSGKGGTDLVQEG